MQKKLNVAVLGSTGYVGLELIKLLSKHPNVKINFLGSEHPKQSLSKINSKFYKINLKSNQTFDPSKSDFVFLALPHGVSQFYEKKFFDKIKIIDLSADFRLDKLSTYKKSYESKHICSNLLKKFVYGLPEINKNLIKKSNNISVPGCYPTSILLPLIPLLKKQLIKNQNIIIDSKSGYSGAGKKFDLKNIRTNNDYNFYNYNTNSHRHISEIKQELIKCCSKKISFSFNPHIMPNFRGMMSTIYCDLNYNIDFETISKNLKQFSTKNYFIHFFDKNQRADFFSVQNNNKCIIKIFKHANDRKIIIVSLIDNLIKGAAGQAVQCFNLRNNFLEKLSLDS